jgi:uncharacterized NAD(P)/FAD-binding protein YdhS
MTDCGTLRIHAARLVAMSEEGEDEGAGVRVTARRRGTGEALEFTVDRVINCTGPDGDYTRNGNPLVQSLLQQGLAAVHELRIGLRTSPEGELLGASGEASPGLLTLGPPRSGDLFETTAIPEISAQAPKLAELILERLGIA